LTLINIKLGVYYLDKCIFRPAMFSPPFAVEHGKQRPLSRGAVTDEYVDHVRRDAVATTQLLFKPLEEFNNHPLALPATRAFSPASIGKGYLRAMGIKPILERQPSFPKRYLGHALMVAAKFH